MNEHDKPAPAPAEKPLPESERWRDPYPVGGSREQTPWGERLPR
jgi:hypothetical protein